MSQPARYKRDYDFTSFQTRHSSTPLPAFKLDAEFDAIASVFDEVLLRIKDLQRDDLELANRLVGYDQLKDELRNGFTTPTVWAAGKAYARGAGVYVGRKVYAALAAHTSAADFNTDLVGGKWYLLADFTAVTQVDQSAIDAAAAAAQSAADAATAALGVASALADAQAAAQASSDSAGEASGFAASASASAAAAAQSALDAEAVLTGAMQATTYDPQGIAADAFDRANHTGEQAIETVTGLQDALEKRVRVDAAQALTSAEQAQTLDNLGLSDGWATQPIGVPIPVFENLVSGLGPPTDQAYRYVLLTAGKTGAGGYNNGVLSGETVVGSAPLVSAYATVSMASSPLNGRVVQLINTEGRFVRASTTPGAVENDQMQRITGGMTGVFNRALFSAVPGGAFTPTTVLGTAYDTAGPAQSGYQSFTFDSGNSSGARAGAETRSKNVQATYYMRIK